jgi:hypothetical protein
MPELRCPMCGRPNSETAEVCAFCQARLRPLSVAPSGSDSSHPAPTPSEGETADWLTKLRAQGAGGEPAGTRDLVPEAEPSPVEGEVPNWLARIRARSEEEGQTPPPAATPTPEAQPAQPSEPKATEVPPAEEEPGEAQEPEWLKRLRVRRAYEQEQEPRVSPFGELPVTGSGELPPDWLHVPREEEYPSPATGAPAEVPGAEPSRPRVAEPPQGIPAPTIRPASTEGEAQPPSGAIAGEAQRPVPQAKPGLPRLSPFTQGTDEFVAVPGEAEIPDWLAKVRETAEPTAQEGPLAPGPKAEEPAGTGLDELLAPGVLPEWLTTAQPSVSPPTEAPAEEIEHAVLPPWLQALRPIEGPAIKAEGAEEERVETAGPLSGLKGVLPPVSVFERVPHPPVQREQLEINPTHAAQAELLQRVVLSPESREAKRAGRVGRRPRAWTWGVWALLIIAILAPGIAQGGIFARPATVSLETLKVRNALEALPDNRPVLMAFEFDPSNSAELEAGALAVIDQLMGRGIPIASLSTRPTGPAMAADVVARAEEAHPDFASAGKYLPLGYLPGDAVGLRAFATDPRRPGSALFSPSVWNSPFLQPVTSLEDFSSIILVVAQPQLFQAWIEQVHVPHASVPLYAVISAAAEPMVRPYYESNSPAVEGLVVGLAGAETYDCMNTVNPSTGRCGSVSPADSWWDPFGASVLAAVLVLGVGALSAAGISLVKLAGGKRRE